MVDRYNGIEPDADGVYVMFEDFERLRTALTDISDKAEKFIPGSGDESFHEGLRSQARIADAALDHG